MEITNGTYRVYVHINKVNGKMYVGQTCQEPEKRWKKGKGYIQCCYFYQAIQKYGWDGFEHEIVASNLSQEESNAFEVLLINMLNTMNPMFGYNLKSGGQTNGFLSETTKAKIGDGNRGKKRTREQKEAMSAAFRGRKATDESKRKASVTHMSKRFEQYEDMIVAQYSKAGELLNIYNSAVVASELTGINVHAIQNCLTDRSKSSGGYIWRYVIKHNVPKTIECYTFIHNNNRKHKYGTTICQYDKDGTFIRYWKSMTDAANDLNISVNNIWKCCSHTEGRKSAGGFLWAYKDDISTVQND